jgi:hypothetical protein
MQTSNPEKMTPDIDGEIATIFGGWSEQKRKRLEGKVRLYNDSKGTFYRQTVLKYQPHKG